MSGNSNKKIAFNYFGGKFTWLEHLYANFPAEFTHLIDLFAGSMIVSINYRGRVIRTANEINGEITNFFQQLRDHEEELVRALRLTPVSELEYRNCWGGLARFQILNEHGGSMFGCDSRSSASDRSERTKVFTWPSSKSTLKVEKRFLGGRTV